MIKVGVLFTGGKDSTYAIYKLVKKGLKVVCLITIKSENPNSWMFHTPNIDLVMLQSKAVQTPLIFVTTKGEKEKELKDLEKAIQKAKEKHRIQAVVSGAVASQYQKKRIEKICKKLKLKTINPLWHMNQEKLLREMIKNGFVIKISSVAAEGLNRDWLGKKLDLKALEELKILNKRVGLNIAFEGGEAETLVTDAPIFTKKIVIEKAEKVMESEFCGFWKVKKAKLEKK